MKTSKKFKLKNLLRPHLLALYLLIIVGAYLRLTGVFTNSFGFTYDVGRDLLAVNDLVTGEKISLIGATTGLPGVFYGPWWYLMLSPFFLIFRGDPTGIALTMAVIGIVLIPIAYLLGKKINSENLGLIFASLVAVSPELISLSSQIWNPNIAPLFVLFIFLLLIKIYSKEDKPWLYFVLGLLLFLTVDIEIIFGLFLMISVIASIIFIKRLKIKPISIAAFIFGGVIILSPRILFEVKHSFLMTQSFIRYFASGAESSRVTGGFLNTFINRIDIFLNEYSYTLTFGNKLVGAILLILSVSLLILFFKKLSVIERDLLKTSGITIAVFFIGTLFFAHEIWPHYLVGLPIVYILFTGIALFALRYKLKNNLPTIIILALLLITNLNPIALINNLRSPLWEGDASLYRNQLAVIDYVYSNNNEFKYVVYTPPVHDYTYQYLFNWRAKKFNKSPVQNATVAYFILEPDKEDPSRLQKWLDDRKNDGKIVSSKKMNGGIVVQKRIVEQRK